MTEKIFEKKFFAGVLANLKKMKIFATKFLIFELNYYLGHYSDKLTIQKKISKFFLNLKFSEKFGIFLFA